MCIVAKGAAFRFDSLAMPDFSVTPIGTIRSTLKTRGDAPLFYNEGAPDARLEILPAYRDGLERLQVGDELIILSWFHQADRSVLKVHPRGNPANPLTGVFLTRSPDRPNPIGLHRVTVRERHSDHLLIGPIEAIDGTPVVDIKRVVDTGDH
jgi:tRNA-Thr(GGU) m(6)t(6)A37 methyltransferase TsaA